MGRKDTHTHRVNKWINKGKREKKKENGAEELSGNLTARIEGPHRYYTLKEGQNRQESMQQSREGVGGNAEKAMMWLHWEFFGGKE